MANKRPEMQKWNLCFSRTVWNCCHDFLFLQGPWTLSLWPWLWLWLLFVSLIAVSGYMFRIKTAVGCHSFKPGDWGTTARCPLPIAALSQTFISSWLGFCSPCWLKIVLYREDENQVRTEKICYHCVISKLAVSSAQTGGHCVSYSFAYLEHLPVALSAICMCYLTPAFQFHDFASLLCICSWQQSPSFGLSDCHMDITISLATFLSRIMHEWIGRINYMELSRMKFYMIEVTGQGLSEHPAS